MKVKLSWFVARILIAVIIFSLTSVGVFAASSTIEVIPNSGVYENQFNLDIIIDGHGDIFNAAKADLIISPQLKVKDLILGDCGFSFLSTPNIINPSFEGVALGESLEKCTVYSLVVVPFESGDSSVLLDDASVYRYGDAEDVLFTVKNGFFSVTESVEVEALPDLKQIKEPDLDRYTVLLRTYSDTGPETQAKIEIVRVDDGKTYQGVTDEMGSVQFSNIDSGIYTIAIDKDGQEFIDNVINVSGNNHILSLGIKLRTRPDVVTDDSLKTSFLTNKISLIVIGGLTVTTLVLAIQVMKTRKRFK
jgi:hypothetical protein